MLKSVSEGRKLIINHLHFGPGSNFTKHFTSTTTVIVLAVHKSASIDQKMESLNRILKLRGYGTALLAWPHQKHVFHKSQENVSAFPIAKWFCFAIILTVTLVSCNMQQIQIRLILLHVAVYKNSCFKDDLEKHLCVANFWNKFPATAVTQPIILKKNFFLI